MSLAVLSPHLDDAAFSLAEHLSVRPDATIITPFGATPSDMVGKLKYNKLHYEHGNACKLLKAHIVNGPFLDDVYADTRDITNLTDWVADALQGFDEVWFPIGIHHPDHLLTTTATWRNISAQKFALYEELPYRVLYPHTPLGEYWYVDGSPSALEFKRKVCRMYESQIGPDIERCLYAPERLWRVY